MRRSLRNLWIFKGKVPEKFLPLTSISQKLLISPFESRISDVPAACLRSDINLYALTLIPPTTTIVLFVYLHKISAPPHYEVLNCINLVLQMYMLRVTLLQLKFVSQWVLTITYVLLILNKLTSVFQM